MGHRKRIGGACGKLRAVWWAMVGVAINQEARTGGLSTETFIWRPCRGSLVQRVVSFGHLSVVQAVERTVYRRALLPRNRPVSTVGSARGQSL